MLKLIFSVLVFLGIPSANAQNSHLQSPLTPVPTQQKSRPIKQALPNEFLQCQQEVDEVVRKLDCKIPPVLYAPGLKFERNMEFGIQFYAARLGMSFDRLNAVITLTQTPEGKKKLTHFFTGLRCAGLPGDPIQRKNWRAYLPECPDKAPKSPPWYKDSKSANQTYHPGAASCYRLGAKKPKTCDEKLSIWECMNGTWLKEIPTDISEILKENSPSQQCCYDKDNARIISGPGAGTPDLVFKTHFVEDIVREAMDESQQGVEMSGHYPKDGKASLEHHIMDARIITACFPDWPGTKDNHVKTYQSLGWGPLR
ncbi:MAG: hypothetical protein EB078_06405 [Proteobacteria bacterium]|nr:hypothetical protein [Pseudomonadota bacterium]NDC24599.1 hypothetical protein [Pseudomonadota bacterium]NDD04518.1 hypothetical protein [Pseudomonadota bacterium]NDG25996.1 hypothetical protein [Pseudomonadota bacterium]